MEFTDLMTEKALVSRENSPYKILRESFGIETQVASPSKVFWKFNTLRECEFCLKNTNIKYGARWHHPHSTSDFFLDLLHLEHHTHVCVEALEDSDCVLYYLVGDDDCNFILRDNLADVKTILQFKVKQKANKALSIKKY